MEEIRRTIKLSIEVSLMYRSEKRESKISGRREGRKTKYSENDKSRVYKEQLMIIDYDTTISELIVSTFWREKERKSCIFRFLYKFMPISTLFARELHTFNSFVDL